MIYFDINLNSPFRHEKIAAKINNSNDLKKDMIN